MRAGHEFIYVCLKVCSNTVLFFRLFQWHPSGSRWILLMMPAKSRQKDQDSVAVVRPPTEHVACCKTASFSLFQFYIRKKNHLISSLLIWHIKFFLFFGKHGHCVLQAKEKKSIVRKPESVVRTSVSVVVALWVIYMSVMVPIKLKVTHMYWFSKACAGIQTFF